MVTTLDILPIMGTEQLSSEEEGEIIEVDDDDDDDDAPIEFEDISSDEELNLRQRIEELEARNLELEKIASISKSAAAVGPIDDYGSSPRGPDMDYIDLVDGDSSPVHQQHATHHHHHRRAAARHRPTPDDNNTTISSRHHSARHRHSATGTAHHRQTTRLQHEHVQRSRSRDHHAVRHHHEHRKRRPASPDGRTTTGRTVVVAEPRLSVHSSITQRDSRSHRTTNNQHHPANAQHQQSHHNHSLRATQHRHSYAPYVRSRSTSSSASTTSSRASSSSSNPSTSARAVTAAAPPLSDEPPSSSSTVYRPDRNVLRAALKRDTASKVGGVSSSLQRKLQGIQKSVTQYIASGVADIVEEQEVSASIEIMELLETLTEANHADSQTTNKTTQAAGATKSDGSAVIKLSDTDEAEYNGYATAATDGKRTPIDQQLEAISLEEQELRLAALKSAILKKHEARKKRKVIEARPYSPTDTDIVLDSHEVAKTTATAGVIGLLNDHDDGDEPQNMEISPVMSPTPSHWLGDAGVADDDDKILQPIDMELSDGSTSPEYPMDEDEDDDEDEDEVKRVAALCSSPTPQWIGLSGMQAIDLPAKTSTTTDIRSFEIFQQQPQQHLVPPEPQEPPPPPPLDKSVLAAAKQAAATAFSDGGQHDDEEEAALRALLLSSKPKRKREVPSTVVPEPIIPAPAAQNASATEVSHDADNSVDNLRTIAMQSLARPRAVAAAVAVRTAAADFHDVSSQKENHTTTQLLPGAEPMTKQQPTSAKPAVAIIPEHILTDTNRQLQPEGASISAKSAAIAIKRKAIAMANGSAASADGCLPRKRPRPRSSALITSLPVRPVKPLVIRFDQSSGSDESDEWAAESQTNNTTSSLDRFFDPASPASFAMDSPAYAPGSPMMDQPATTTTKTPSPLPQTALFEQKLEAYLRSVRSKNQPAQPAEVAAKKPTKMMVTTKSGPATPLVVRHLPLSSQLEYKQLVLRMSMLEQKKRAKQQQPPAEKRPTKAAINEGSPTAADSLIKQVLVKNGTEAAMKASTLNVNAKPYVSAVIISTATTEAPAKTAPQAEPAANDTAADTETPVTAVEPAKCQTPAADSSKLRTLEIGYRQKSAHLHASLQSQQLRLAHALRVRTKQLQLERERDRVQLQLQQIERDVAVQRAAFKQLCPRIVSAHREMRAERSACALLARHCAQLGRQSGGGGDEVVYTIPGDNHAQIDVEFDKIHKQTHRLKSLHKEQLLVDEPLRTKDAEPVSVAVSSTTTTKAATPTNEPAVAETPTSTDLLPSAEAAEPAEAVEAVAADPAEPCSDDGAAVACGDGETTTTVHPTAVDTGPTLASGVQKYQSPLDHITQSSVVNPDVVLCPFEMQGRCDDQECAYQHLSARGE